MTDNEFTLTLAGIKLWAADGDTRLRTIVADAFDTEAHALRDKDDSRRSKGVLHISYCVRAGFPLTKRSRTKYQPEIARVRAVVVDGVSLSGV